MALLLTVSQDARELVLFVPSDPLERPGSLRKAVGTPTGPGRCLVRIVVVDPHVAAGMAGQLLPALGAVRLSRAGLLRSRTERLVCRPRIDTRLRVGAVRKPVRRRQVTPRSPQGCQPILRQGPEDALRELPQIGLEVGRIRAVHDRLPEHRVLFR